MKVKMLKKLKLIELYIGFTAALLVRATQKPSAGS